MRLNMNNFSNDDIDALIGQHVFGFDLEKARFNYDYECGSKNWMHIIENDLLSPEEVEPIYPHTGWAQKVSLDEGYFFYKSIPPFSSCMDDAFDAFDEFNKDRLYRLEIFYENKKLVVTLTNRNTKESFPVKFDKNDCGDSNDCATGICIAILTSLGVKL